MEFLIVLAIIVVVLLVAFAQIKAGKIKKTSEGLAYEPQPYLFTAAERQFLTILEQVAGREYRVYGKVRVADVLKVRSGSSRSIWQKAQNKITHKHVDFVICPPSNTTILCAIELNDKSHQRKDRVERDKFLKEAFESASMPLIFVPTNDHYDIDELRKLLSPYLTGKVAHYDNTKLCPKCQSEMVLKIATKGKKPGQPFMACSGFPKCRYTASIMDS